MKKGLPLFQVKAPERRMVTGFVSQKSLLPSFFGPSDRVRTCGLMVPTHPRYQLRYTRIFTIQFTFRRFSQTTRATPRNKQNNTPLAGSRPANAKRAENKQCARARRFCQGGRNVQIIAHFCAAIQAFTAFGCAPRSSTRRRPQCYGSFARPHACRVDDTHPFPAPHAKPAHPTSFAAAPKRNSACCFVFCPHNSSHPYGGSFLSRNPKTALKCHPAPHKNVESPVPARHPS